MLIASLAFATGSAAAKPVRIVAFGDSLMAGYMLPDGDGFAPKLQAALVAQGHDAIVINAGVSGDTTTDGLARLDWTLADGADAVILELGANDMLRGIDPKITRDNLAKMLANLKARKIKVLIAGIRAVPSLGKDYAVAFDPIYPVLAKRYDVPLYPFFLEGVMGDRAQHLPDQLHPNVVGVDTIVKNILPSVDALLKTVETKS
jgi:acyl-CoA thioesterase-1